MFPINVSLFTHLGKNCCAKIFASQEAKMFPNKFRNIFVAETMFPRLPTCFQMFSGRKHGFPNREQYFKTK